MTFDAHKNFAYSSVAVAPSPASSGTSLTVASGDGTLFPTTPFNCTVWPPGVLPLASNAEIVRVTNIAGDVFTITRAQEGSSARSILVGDQIGNTITAKVITDIENTLGTGATVVFSSTLGADTASMSTGANGIPAGFHAIQILLLLRTTEPSTASTVLLTINNDGGSNYDVQRVSGVNATASAANALTGTSWGYGCDGASSAANFFSTVFITIPFYANTSAYKRANTLFAKGDSTATTDAVSALNQTWRSTAAINQITVTAPATFKLAAGSAMVIFAF